MNRFDSNEDQDLNAPSVVARAIIYSDVTLDEKVKQIEDVIIIEREKLESIQETLLDSREEIVNDERMSYKSANVFSNAPLAIHQACQASKLALIERVLDIPFTEIPIKK